MRELSTRMVFMTLANSAPDPQQRQEVNDGARVVEESFSIHLQLLVQILPRSSLPLLCLLDLSNSRIRTDSLLALVVLHIDHLLAAR